MYIPQGASTLEKMEITQIRLGIQGAFGTGKTFASLTFPNPTVVNFDRGLVAHAGRKDVVEVPFWDPMFIKTIMPSDITNRRDAFEKWLNKELTKFEADQTLVIDGSTGLQNAFDLQESKEPVFTKSNRIDEFAYWRHKVEYFGRICEMLKQLRCHVVYICHETPDRNDKGELNGKLRPLMTGQFADQLGSHFTDWYRQHALDKPTPEKIATIDLKKFGCKSIPEYNKLLEQFPFNTAYWFQTESDDLFNAKCSLLNAPRFIPANFIILKQYLKAKIS